MEARAQRVQGSHLEAIQCQKSWLFPLETQGRHVLQTANSWFSNHYFAERRNLVCYAISYSLPCITKTGILTLPTALPVQGYPLGQNKNVCPIYLHFFLNRLRSLLVWNDLLLYNAQLHVSRRGSKCIWHGVCVYSPSIHKRYCSHTVLIQNILTTTLYGGSAL